MSGKVEVAVDGALKAERAWTCDYTRATPCANRSGAISVLTRDFADGTHRCALSRPTRAGNRNATEFSFKADNNAPGRVAPYQPGGQGWRQANSFNVRWQNPPQAHAPITRVRYRLCPASGPPCSTGTRDGNNIEGLSNLPVKALGDNTLKVWLEDQAGNQTEALASDAVHLRLDPEAPRLAFLPQDPNDPLTVAVRARDSYSGVAAGQVEMRARGGRTWHELDTRLDAGKLVADIDDERFREGTYDFRARASDRAGNEASTATTVNGARAAIRLPVRIKTGLRAGFVKTKIRRRTVRRNGKRRVVRRPVRVLVPRATIRFGRRASVRGTLANPDGQPIDGAGITVLGRRDVPGETFATLGLIRTDGRGRFRYRVKASANRLLRFRYAGSRRIRGATRHVRLRVPAATTISASPRRLLNGQTVTFAGRVRSGPVPRTGKLVEIQAFFRSRWRTISTTRSDARGQWRFPYRFGGTVGAVDYRFRARLPREGGYPFGTGVSRVARVIVRGL